MRRVHCTNNAPFDPRSHLTRADINLLNSSASILLKRSKTDPCGEGVTIYIGAATSPLCTVTALGQYLQFSEGSEDDPAFRYHSGKLLTREAFIQGTRVLLNAAGLQNVSNYAGHSFRIGLLHLLPLPELPSG